MLSVQVSQLQHVVSVKDALLQVYTHASDELDSPTTYVLFALSSVKTLKEYSLDSLACAFTLFFRQFHRLSTLLNMHLCLPAAF